MWHIFKLLFSTNYWRMLLRGETWRSTWKALQRAHKDRRAWKQFAKALFLLLVPLSLPVLIAGIAVQIALGGQFVFGGVAIIWIFVLFMGLLSRTAFGSAKQQKQADTVQTLNLNSAEPVMVNTPELRREFAERALLLAVLADRAGSESFLRTKVLPEGLEIITRRRHLEILRGYNMYDRLGGAERALLLLPDGHWPPAAIDNVILSLEPLRLLRWVLRLDSFLPVVGDTLRADFRMASALLAEPAPLFQATSLVSVQGLETAFNAADQYFYRCFAEGVRRGFFTVEKPEEQERAIRYAAKLDGKEGEDFLLGATIVSKADDPTVRLAATLALRRARFLSWIKSRVFNQIELSPQIEGFQIHTLSEYE